MAETKVSGEESYVSKLTVATLGCQPVLVKALPPDQTKLSLCRIFGKCSGVGYQDDKERGAIHTFFKGNFEGINLQDGTVLRSGKMYLPKGISEVMEKVVNEVAAKEGGNAVLKESVAFAFEIRSVKAGNKIGYSYEAVALKDPHAEDELAAMRTAIASMPTHEQKQLAGKNTSGGKTLEGQQSSRKSA